MDAPNGGIVGHLIRGEWSEAGHCLLAITAAARPDWLTQRIGESAVIGILSAALTTGAGYLLLVPRLDERVKAIQRDVDVRIVERKEGEAQLIDRVKRIEDRQATQGSEIVKELAGIHEQLGRLDGRTADRRPR